MKNKSPIILNCFSRGGSNILWNYFLSHPDVCHPMRETLEIFKTKVLSNSWIGIKLLYIAKQDIFNQWNFKKRKPVNGSAKKFIDKVLFEQKLKNYYDEEMIFKTQDLKYTKSEIEMSRLVMKNNNGLVYCTELFFDMYPDATFIALIRNPIALYESHKRRNTPPAKSPQVFANYYKNIFKKMKEDSKKIKNYHLMKFEDLLLNPIGSLKSLYEKSGLDFRQIEKIRLKSKPFMNKYGTHETKFIQNKHYWFSKNEIVEFLEPGVNDNQIAMLNSYDQKYIMDELHNIMDENNYLVK